MNRNTNNLSLGLDIGSRTTKALIWDSERVVHKVLIPTGWSPEESAKIACERVLSEASIPLSAVKIVVTGYGRLNAKDFSARVITEITAHARGTARVLPHARTLIDIGGQDSKVIVMEERGLVSDFAMNDRCAAGSGKFLELLALSMNMEIEEFAEMAYRSAQPRQISSLCTVFAESEVLSLLAEGASREDVAAGAHRAIAQRVANMARNLHPQAPIAFSGGVARNRSMVKELSRALGSEILVPDGPEYMGALGAAIIAGEGW